MIFICIYLANIIAVLLACRWSTNFNKEVHRIFNAKNPAVFGALVWPILYLILIIYHGSKLITAIMNWISGNGFVTETQEAKEWTPLGL